MLLLYGPGLDCYFIENQVIVFIKAFQVTVCVYVLVLRGLRNPFLVLACGDLEVLIVLISEPVLLI